MPPRPCHPFILCLRGRGMQVHRTSQTDHLLMPVVRISDKDNNRAWLTTRFHILKNPNNKKTSLLSGSIQPNPKPTTVYRSITPGTHGLGSGSSLTSLGSNNSPALHRKTSPRGKMEEASRGYNSGAQGSIRSFSKMSLDKLGPLQHRLVRHGLLPAHPHPLHLRDMRG